MGRKPTPEARLNEIRQYVEEGHTYDEAANKFKNLFQVMSHLGGE